MMLKMLQECTLQIIAEKCMKTVLENMHLAREMANEKQSTPVQPSHMILKRSNFRLLDHTLELLEI